MVCCRLGFSVDLYLGKLRAKNEGGPVTYSEGLVRYSQGPATYSQGPVTYSQGLVASKIVVIAHREAFEQKETAGCRAVRASIRSVRGQSRPKRYLPHETGLSEGGDQTVPE
jgi:hypothetical protein